MRSNWVLGASGRDQVPHDLSSSHRDRIPSLSLASGWREDCIHDVWRNPLAVSLDVLAKHVPNDTRMDSIADLLVRELVSLWPEGEAVRKALHPGCLSRADASAPRSDDRSLCDGDEGW